MRVVKLSPCEDRSRIDVQVFRNFEKNCPIHSILSSLRVMMGHILKRHGMSPRYEPNTLIIALPFHPTHLTPLSLIAKPVQPGRITSFGQVELVDGIYPPKM